MSDVCIWRKGKSKSKSTNVLKLKLIMKSGCDAKIESYLNEDEK